MRILHLDSAEEWRGGQVQLALLMERLSGFEQALACPAAAALRPVAERIGVPVFPSPFRGPLGGVAAISRAIAAFRPDLVAAHTSRAHGAAVLASGGPVVVHRRLDFAPRALSRWKYRLPRGYIAVSDAVAAVLGRAGVAADRVAVVRDGVDVARWTRAAPPVRPPQVPASTPLILAAGALVPHKGHRFLVGAMAELPAFHLVIAGEGPLRQDLTDQASAVAPGRVHLLGHVPEIEGLLAGCDVFAHPSVEEGMGQVVAEALLAGRPVVATDAGGVPEVVGSRGIVVPRGDSAGLAAGIRRAFDERLGWREAALAARDELASAFGADRMAEETGRAYREFGRR
jgi:glycosyltransferase involved in cell wall biosynthesis